MSKVIVYPLDNGEVAVLTPVFNNAFNPETKEWLPLKPKQKIPEGFVIPSIEQIAEKDVPEGKEFKILDVSELPDRDKRPGWVYSKDTGVEVNQTRYTEFVLSNPEILISQLKLLIESLPLESQVRFSVSGVIPNILSMIREGNIPVAVAMVNLIPTDSMTAQELSVYSNIKAMVGLSND